MESEPYDGFAAVGSKLETALFCSEVRDVIDTAVAPALFDISVIKLTFLRKNWRRVVENRSPPCSSWTRRFRLREFIVLPTPIIYKATGRANRPYGSRIGLQNYDAEPTMAVIDHLILAQIQY